MPAVAVSSPRPYLRAELRRNQLLEAADRLFARSGYAGITMQAVAAEAGVSRRLVYDHFSDLSTLYTEVFAAHAVKAAAVVDAVFEDGDADPQTRLSRSFARILALPPDDLKAIRTLIGDAGLPELEHARSVFRAHTELRWLSMLEVRGVDISDVPRARAILWTIVTGIFSLADLVARGELDVATAAEMAPTFAIAVATAHATTPARATA